MNSGFVKLYRKLIDWDWYADPNTIRLFLHLLLTANYEPQRWQGMVIQPGQLLTGRIKLAQELGLTERKIRTSLKKLKTTGEIAIKTTNCYSIVTICKWEDYQTEQIDKRPAKRPAGSPTRDQQPTTIKEGKESKEEKKNTVDRFDNFWDAYGKKTGREKCLEKWLDLTDPEIEKILTNVPKYVESTPEVQYRKNPLTYLNGKHWNDEFFYQETNSTIEEIGSTTRNCEFDFNSLTLQRLEVVQKKN